MLQDSGLVATHCSRQEHMHAIVTMFAVTVIHCIRPGLVSVLVQLLALSIFMFASSFALAAASL